MVMEGGYRGSILKVDLTSVEFRTVPTARYADRFLGGRGMALKIHWDEVPPGIEAFDPENRLVFMTGPVCGVPGFAGSRWQVSGKSPVYDRWSYCNLGGAWGAQLKFAGYDGIIVHGKSDKLVYLFIENDRVELRDASALKGKGAIATRRKLKSELGKSFRVVAIGAAGENRVHFATLTADQDCSGSGGLGAVMGSKNLKAVVVRGHGKIEVAHKEKISFLRKKVKELKTPARSWPTILPQERIKKDICFGCIDGCMRSTYTAQDGEMGKYICQSAMFYEIRGQRYYGNITDVSFHANKLCDDYGVDTRAVEAIIMWLVRCFKSGILTEDKTGLPLSKIGSLEYIDTLLRKISFREGFGDILANGTAKAAQKVGKGSEKFITDYMAASGEIHVYGARLYLTTGLLYAFDPRLPIQQLHEISMQGMAWAARETGLGAELGGVTSPYTQMDSKVFRKIAKKFWGDEICADFSTYKGKPMAAVRIQDRQFAKECLILCDFSYPIIYSPVTADHVGDPTLESQICAAVTGMNMDEQGLYRLGERAFNLQRAVLSREGHRGRENDSLEEFNFNVPLKGDWGNPECLVPGKNGEPFSRKGMILGRNEFEKMKDEFYEIRGWDVATGLQTRAKLEELDMADIANGLEQAGLIAET